MNELETLTGETTLQNKCIEFGAILGLDEPVSETVLLGALNDSAYAHNLLVSRKTPDFLDVLLENPPYQPQAEIISDEKSTIELVAELSQAIWRWSKTGFSTVDEEVYDRRYAACQACPHFVDPPKKALYKLLKADGPDAKICDLCGCVAPRKAHLTSESCAAPHPSIPGVNRWGEAMS